MESLSLIPVSSLPLGVQAQDEVVSVGVERLGQGGAAYLWVGSFVGTSQGPVGVGTGGLRGEDVRLKGEGSSTGL